MHALLFASSGTNSSKSCRERINRIELVNLMDRVLGPLWRTTSMKGTHRGIYPNHVPLVLFDMSPCLHRGGDLSPPTLYSIPCSKFVGADSPGSQYPSEGYAQR